MFRPTPARTHCLLDSRSIAITSTTRTHSTLGATRPMIKDSGREGDQCGWAVDDESLVEFVESRR